MNLSRNYFDDEFTFIQKRKENHKACKALIKAHFFPYIQQNSNQ